MEFLQRNELAALPPDARLDYAAHSAAAQQLQSAIGTERVEKDTLRKKLDSRIIDGVIAEAVRRHKGDPVILDALLRAATPEVDREKETATFAGATANGCQWTRRLLHTGLTRRKLATSVTCARKLRTLSR